MISHLITLTYGRLLNIIHTSACLHKCDSCRQILVTAVEENSPLDSMTFSFLGCVCGERGQRGADMHTGC
jgi:hypothetical protein